MIRFACRSCQGPLRAPAHLAGKRGRCARCGAINPIPNRPAEPAAAPATNVAVKRAPEPSPFRSTVDVAGGRPAFVGGTALMVAPAPAPSGPADFLDHLAGRMGMPAQHPATAQWNSNSTNPAHAEVGDLPAPSSPSRDEEDVQRRIYLALAAGLVFGAVLGAFVARVFF